MIPSLSMNSMPISTGDASSAQGTGQHSNGSGSSLMSSHSLGTSQGGITGRREPTPEEKWVIDHGLEIIFPTKAQAEKVLGQELPKDLRFPSFRVIRNDDGSTTWLAVEEKRAGNTSIIDPEKNKINIFPAGELFTIAAKDSGSPLPFTENEFLNMHAHSQIACMLMYGKFSNIPPSIYLAMSGVTAVLSSDGRKAIILQQLDNRAIAGLPLADQEAVNARPEFASIKISLGLTTDAPTAIDSTKQAINNLFSDLRPDADPAMAEEHKELFINQLNLLSNGLKDQLFFNQKNIEEEAAAILSRFKTAFAYGNTPKEIIAPTDHNPINHSYIISLDDKQSIKSAYRTFIDREQRLLEQGQFRQNIVNGTVSNPKLDTLALISQLMMSYRTSMTERAAIIKQEIDQLNELLKTYGEMQRIIAQTSANHPDGDPKKPRILGGDTEGAPPNEVSHVDFIAAQNAKSAGSGDLIFKAATMFNAESNNKAKHPVEELHSIGRPDLKLFQTNADSKMYSQEPGVWTNYSAQLSDTVTLLNQESQAKMNEMTNAEREANRFLELANNAISKMNETIQSIARSLG